MVCSIFLLSTRCKKVEISKFIIFFTKIVLIYNLIYPPNVVSDSK